MIRIIVEVFPGLEEKPSQDSQPAVVTAVLVPEVAITSPLGVQFVMGQVSGALNAAMSQAEQKSHEPLRPKIVVPEFAKPS